MCEDICMVILYQSGVVFSRFDKSKDSTTVHNANALVRRWLAEHSFTNTVLVVTR